MAEKNPSVAYVPDTDEAREAILPVGIRLARAERDRIHAARRYWIRWTDPDTKEQVQYALTADDDRHAVERAAALVRRWMAKGLAG